MPINIIVKDRTPSWRPKSSKLGSFKSLHKDGKTIDKSAPVEKMYSRSELEHIANCCRNTSVMISNSKLLEESETES